MIKFVMNMSQRLTRTECLKGKKENLVKIVIIYAEINKKERRIRTLFTQRMGHSSHNSMSCSCRGKSRQQKILFCEWRTFLMAP